MIEIIDIYASVNNLLKQKYKDIKRYCNDVKGGFEKPSFFVSIITRANKNESINFKFKQYSIVITYFQKNKDEIDNLKKISEIEELFGNCIEVKDRYVRVTDLESDFAGEENNILQVTIDIEFYDEILRKETCKLADSIVMKEA